MEDTVKTLNRLAQMLKMGAVIIWLVFSFHTNAVYARGGCFSSGTSILTPAGHTPIEQLQPGDRITGLNFSTHQMEAEELGDIQVLHSPDYYLINGSIKVTETHPFYVQGTNLQQETEWSLTKVQDLKVGDALLGENDAQVVVTSIDHIDEPLTVYNLLSVTPDHNFYAGGVLVHNKGGGGGGGSGGGGGGSYIRGSGHGTPINKTTVAGFALSVTIFLLVVPPVVFWYELYNLVRFWGKDFTDDADLIEFAERINGQFLNRYALNYSEDTEEWVTTPPHPALDEQIYQAVLTQAELVEKVSDLFVQYQTDWSQRAFENMTDYVAQPFYDAQYRTFQRSFGNNVDAIYQPTLQAIVPLSYQSYQQAEEVEQEAEKEDERREDQHIFRVQINATMVNFELSPRGTVVSGKAYPRGFTEYWEIAIREDKACHLLNIYLTHDP
ncbi:MAG: Hint domain-containing protein [Cyanobacteria bacterium P01_F01_bin.53]